MNSYPRTEKMWSVFLAKNPKQSDAHILFLFSFVELSVYKFPVASLALLESTTSLQTYQPIGLHAIVSLLLLFLYHMGVPSEFYTVLNKFVDTRLQREP